MTNYATPKGYIDGPFLYVFDAAAFTDGQTVRNLTVQHDGDGAFLLRRVLGLTQCAQAIRLFDGRNVSRTPKFIQVGDDWPIAPEIEFTRQIGFDLQNVLRAKLVGPPDVYVSQICFQGVKRRRALSDPEETFRETSYSIPFDLTLDWRYLTGGGQVERTRQFRADIRDFPFELRRISICYADGTAVNNGIFSIRLYDHHGRPMSNVPVLQQYVNYRAAGNLAMFPVPAAVYPVGTSISFDVQSNIVNTDVAFPKNVQINFEGVRRVGV